MIHTDVGWKISLVSCWSPENPESGMPTALSQHPDTLIYKIQVDWMNFYNFYDFHTTSHLNSKASSFIIVTRECRINQELIMLDSDPVSLLTNTKSVASVVKLCVSRIGLCCSTKYHLTMTKLCTQCTDGQMWWPEDFFCLHSKFTYFNKDLLITM